MGDNCRNFRWTTAMGGARRSWWLLFALLMGWEAGADDAVQRSQVAPEQEQLLLRRVAVGYPGWRVLRVKHETHGATLVYEVKLLSPTGEVEELTYRPDNLALIEREVDTDEHHELEADHHDDDD